MTRVDGAFFSEVLYQLHRLFSLGAMATREVGDGLEAGNIVSLVSRHSSISQGIQMGVCPRVKMALPVTAFYLHKGMSPDS